MGHWVKVKEILDYGDDGEDNDSFEFRFICVSEINEKLSMTSPPTVLSNTRNTN